MPALIVRTGPLQGRRVTISGVLVVGREGVDLVIEDARLSRRHAAFRETAGALEVEDLSSKNGTLVDGRRIGGATRLQHGSVITMGASQFAAELDDAPVESRRAQAMSPDAPVAPGPAGAISPDAPVAPGPAGAISPVAPVARRGGLATRSWVPVALSFGTLGVTLVALVVYFAVR